MMVSVFASVCFNIDVVCVIELPIDHTFSVFNHELTRQWGFHPRVPQALRNTDNSSTRAAV